MIRWLALVLLYGVTALGGAELVARWKWPWLAPPSSDESVSESGLPRARLAERMRQLGRGDVYFIGDSFVQSGELPHGWITSLQDLRPVSLGFAGAAPSQYFLLLKKLRAFDPKALAVIVLYLGNDLADEGIFGQLGSNLSGYGEAHQRFYANPERDTFAPCRELPSRWPLVASAKENLALYRLLTIVSYKPSVFTQGWTDADFAGLMRARCTATRFAEQIGGRLFFLRHHQALLDTSDPTVALGRERLLRLLQDARQDPNLVFVVVLDREETCRSFHGRPVRQAAPFIDTLRKLGLRVIDPNPVLEEACRTDELYLPDGHWNTKGQRLFAGVMRRFLAGTPGAPPS